MDYKYYIPLGDYADDAAAVDAADAVDVVDAVDAVAAGAVEAVEVVEVVEVVEAETDMVQLTLKLVKTELEEPDLKGSRN